MTSHTVRDSLIEMDGSSTPKSRTTMRVLRILLLGLCSTVGGFTTTLRHVTTRTTRCAAAKGFGNKKDETTTQKQESPKRSKPAAATMNSGQQALMEMRRKAAESKDAELRQVREILSQDEQMKTAEAAIPEPVAMRMGKRMIPFVGIPLFGGMGTFVGFWYMATYRDLEFQPALVATSTFVLLALGLVGITYSVMSASWDPDREGSFLGQDELKKNIQTIRDGLSRSRDNAVVRDKMAQLSEDEIQSALRGLNKRESVEKKRTATLEEKLNS